MKKRIPTLNEFTNEKEFSEEEREKLADKGIALPDGSYPIETLHDLKNAIQAVGRAKDYEKAKKHIIKRAKALGKTDELPEDWVNENVNINEKYKFISIPKTMREIHSLMANIESYQDVVKNKDLYKEVQMLDERIQALANYLINKDIV